MQNSRANYTEPYAKFKEKLADVVQRQVKKKIATSDKAIGL